MTSVHRVLPWSQMTNMMTFWGLHQPYLWFWLNNYCHCCLCLFTFEFSRILILYQNQLFLEGKTMTIFSRQLWEFRVNISSLGFRDKGGHLQCNNNVFHSPFFQHAFKQYVQFDFRFAFGKEKRKKYKMKSKYIQNYKHFLFLLCN